MNLCLFLSGYKLPSPVKDSPSQSNNVGLKKEKLYIPVHTFCRRRLRNKLDGFAFIGFLSFYLFTLAPCNSFFLEGESVVSGLRAAKRLLNTARLNQKRNGFDVYDKLGGNLQALKDFYAVRPKDVKNLPRVNIRGINMFFFFFFFCCCCCTNAFHMMNNGKPRCISFLFPNILPP